MKYCRHCQVQVRGNHKDCPLCKNITDKSPGNEKDIFPEIPPSYKRHLMIRIMVFISIVAIVISFALDAIFPTNINRPFLVIFGILSMWLCLFLILKTRHNATKTIMWQVTVISILSILWDALIGWSGWSLTYVIPTVCVAAMLVMYVTAKVMKLSARDYIIYLLLDGLFGFIPILFILFDWVDVTYPSIICIAVSIIFISAIFIFQGEDIKIELDKRMHV